MPVDWVYDLLDKEVVFTGRDEEYERSDLAAIARGMGASVKGDVGNSTDILVRGFSSQWKYGDYGNREKQVARMQSWGHRIVIIDSAGFHELRRGFPTPTIAPHVPDVAARLPASLGGTLGAPYRSGQFAEPVALAGDSYRDPDAVDRGLQAHSCTQDALARHLEDIGFTPLSAFSIGCNFDLAWDRRDGTCGVAEVKSLTIENEIFQIRHGLGQVLDYGFRLRTRGFEPQLFLVLERQPERVEHWSSLCTESGVTLTFAPEFAEVR